MRFVLRPGRVLAACAVLILIGTATACASAGSADPASAEGRGSVTVFAASSLTDVVDTLNSAYAGGGRLRVNVGSSSQLVAQIQSGARADVVITADPEALEPLRAEVDREAALATNRLVLALAPENPAGIEVLRDVSAAGVRTVLCAPAVPCGRAAGKVLEAEGLELAAPSLEDNVRSVLTKVSSGQADAGFVYRTDALAAAGSGVTFLPLAGGEPNTYPAALTVDGAGNSAAVAFYEWLTGPEAAGILREAGFVPENGSEPGNGSGAAAEGNREHGRGADHVG